MRFKLHISELPSQKYILNNVRHFKYGTICKIVICVLIIIVADFCLHTFVDSKTVRHLSSCVLIHQPSLSLSVLFLTRVHEAVLSFNHINHLPPIINRPFS